jgi:alkanesulfonate monooxygenase SsuD/methylene tetrahydromethanopterin reductase-like flavin-dependent oxidoreductase (luciferase family)
MSYRNPAYLAKLADTIEDISGGRLILGLGAGWHEPEYRAMGLPYDHRVSRFEEALQIIHGLLHDGQIDFDGRYYQARECELRPRGPRPNGPPILIGSQGPRMLGLVAKYADQWNAFFAATHNTATGVPQLRAEVDAACAAAGRDPSTLERNAAVLVGYGPTQGIPHDVPALTGSNEEITAALAAYAAEGIGHLIVYVNPMTLEGIERFQPVLEALKASA